MKNPKVFIISLFIVAVLLLIFDLPQGLKIGKFSIPQNINLKLGSISFQKNISYRLGLDLQGGAQLTYEVGVNNIPAAQQATAFEAARSVIDRRVNYFGVGESTIQTLKLGKSNRIIVELPGLSKVSDAINLIGQTAELSFWEGGPASGNISAKDQKSLEDAGVVPFSIFKALGGNPVKTKLSGKDLKSSQVVFGSTGASGPQVQLDFTPVGAKVFADITKRNVGKPVAIVIDNQIIEAPKVNQPILTGSAVITGGFTTDTAKSLSIQLNSGALPAPLTLIGQNTIGPSLGINSLKKSLLAGLIGFISVVIFMSYLYKKEGVIASAALSIYIIFTLAVFKFIPVTFTLAGIAGFILSIGMAVDANILIFERMHEELREGRSRDVAMRLGFTRAWTSIRDSNTSSLITSFILYYFGTGIVKGFALTLAIGIGMSMFSAIVVTRNLLRVFDKN